MGEREWVGEGESDGEGCVEGINLTEKQGEEKEKEKENEEEQEEEWEKEEEEGEGGESISVLAPFFDLMNHDTTVNTVFELINLPKKHGFGLEMVEIETEPVLTVRYRGHGVKKGEQVSLNYRWYVIIFSFFPIFLCVLLCISFCILYCIF
jgi:hypothetical protein